MTSIRDDLPIEISDRYDVVNNTFIGKDKGEIGDIYSDTFQPQFKIKRWGNECNFSVRLVDDMADAPKLQTDKNKIKFVKKKTEAHFYDVPKMDETPECFEFEIILKEKPKTNKVQMSIETKGLAFYYQPKLTQEEIDEGAFRPENVVGSYAVYHESKQGDYSKMGLKNYRAGKAFHIFRPKIIDNAGKEVWGKLNITDNLLTVEIPQEFLDNAVYPIIVDPTFGYTTKGGSSWASSVCALSAKSSQSPDNSAGTVTELKIAALNESYALKVGVYTDNSDAPLNLISGSASTFTPSSPDVNGFYAAGISGFDITANTKYWLSSMVSNSNQQIYFDTFGATIWSKYNCSQTYSEWMQSVFPSSSNSTYRYSIYCTYTAGGAAFIPQIIIT
jgi:hypothetical protein